MPSQEVEPTQERGELAELFISHPHSYKEYADILARTTQGPVRTFVSHCFGMGCDPNR